MKLVWLSDVHLGIKCGELSRNPEIKSIFRQVLNFIKKHKVDSIVLGGDLFDTNHPSVESQTLFSKFISHLIKLKVKIYILVGNHDAINDKDNDSCLKLYEAFSVYGDLSVISEIKCIKLFSDIYGLFLPHITSSKSVSLGYDHVQGYIKNEITTHIPFLKEKKCIIFSHLNVIGPIPGCEEEFLKKSHVYLDERLIDIQMWDKMPEIIQGHIHKKQKFKNVNIVGSPMQMTFAEKETDKYFYYMDFDKDHREFVPIKTNELHQVDLSLIDKTLTEDEVIHSIKNKYDQNSILKIIIEINHGQNLRWKYIKDKLSEYFYYVRPLQFKVQKDEKTRNEEVKIKNSPIQSVKSYLDSMSYKNKKEIYDLAKGLIEGLK